VCATLLDMDDYEADVVELGGEISFDTWKDLKIRNAQGECVPCKKHGVDRKLTSAQKSYYHWSDGCKTSSCSIKACPYVRDVAGLQEWARKERDKWHEAKAARDRIKDLQKQKDLLALEEAANVGEKSPSHSRSESPSLSRSKPSSSEKCPNSDHIWAEFCSAPFHIMDGKGKRAAWPPANRLAPCWHPAGTLESTQMGCKIVYMCNIKFDYE